MKISGKTNRGYKNKIATKTIATHEPKSVKIACPFSDNITAACMAKKVILTTKKRPDKNNKEQHYTIPSAVLVSPKKLPCGSHVAPIHPPFSAHLVMLRNPNLGGASDALAKTCPTCF